MRLVVPRISWPLVRTVIAAVGLGFAGASIVGACLDHYGETSGCESTAPVGSGQGSASADCGAPATSDAGPGSGSGSAAAP
jgi:hypothetical protein